MRIVASLLAVTALLAGLASLAGAGPLDALQVLIDSAFGDGYALHSNTLVRWVPLAMCGLAVTAAFRAGVWNIGVEGQLLAGAIGAFAAAPYAGTYGAVAAGAIAGAAWAGISVIWMQRFAVSVVVVTLLLNFVAELLLSYLVNGPLQEPTHIYPQSAPLPVDALLPRLPGARAHAGIPLTLLMLITAWWFLYATGAGFRLRMTGANPTAARYAGRVDVPRVQAAALLLSGALGGLAGGFEVLGVTGVLYEKLSPGYGYTAIAVALAGLLHPAGVALSAFFFAALEAGAAGLQRDAGIPAVMTLVLEGAAVILVLWAVRSSKGGGNS